MADFSRITTDPAVLQGQPCIRGLRIRVRDILDMVAAGGPWSEILTDYPYLEQADLEAAVAYAAAHVPNFIPETTPLQVTRRLLNGPDILAWAERIGFAPLRALPDLHVTIVYSRWPVSLEDLPMVPTELRVPAGGDRRLARFHGGAIVLTFESDDLFYRHRRFWKSSGWQWDLDAYRPHLTLAYGDHPELLSLEPYRGDLVFGPEVSKALPPFGAEADI